MKWILTVFARYGTLSFSCFMADVSERLRKSLPHSRENLFYQLWQAGGHAFCISPFSSQDQKMVFGWLDWRNNSGNRNFILHMEKLSAGR